MRGLWILCFALVVLGSSSASAINTYRNWDGQTYMWTFGCPDTTTYGQIITTQKDQHTIDRFSFWWATYDGTGSMVVRGEVYAWGERRATGNPLFESEPRQISFIDNNFHKETFATGGIPVTPKTKYVLFASIDKDYEQCSDYRLKWGVLADDIYSHGKFVYQNNGGRYNNWTTQPWYSDLRDLAFTVSLSP